MNFSITILSTAEYDLRYIYEYFATTLLNEDFAKHCHANLKAAIFSLCNMPSRYAVYPHEPWKSRHVRKMTSGKFLIFYIVEDKTSSVYILRVLYGGRNLAECLQEGPLS